MEKKSPICYETSLLLGADAAHCSNFTRLQVSAGWNYVVLTDPIFSAGSLGPCQNPTHPNATPPDESS